eukprot:ctg_4465.g456
MQLCAPDGLPHPVQPTAAPQSVDSLEAAGTAACTGSRNRQRPPRVSGWHEIGRALRWTRARSGEAPAWRRRAQKGDLHKDV